MSGPAHTPGPWVAIDCGNGLEWEVVKPDSEAVDDRWYVARCYEFADGARAEDNARLIAAAPELLEALLDVLDNVGALSNVSEFPNCLNTDIERGREILAIIAKARGEA